jgi:hypothetical protein
VVEATFETVSVADWVKRGLDEVGVDWSAIGSLSRVVVIKS